MSLLSRLSLLLSAFKLVSVGEISSSLGQGKRKRTLSNFKNGKIQVCTCNMNNDAICNHTHNL